MAAVAGGWFFFLRGSDTRSPDTAGTSFENAPEMSDGTHGPYEIVSGENHYFAVGLSQGDQMEVTMEFTHSEGDLDITLHDPARNQVDSGTSTTDDETVSLTAAEAGTYYIRPYGYDGASNSYELVVNIV